MKGWMAQLVDLNMEVVGSSPALNIQLKTINPSSKL